MTSVDILTVLFHLVNIFTFNILHFYITKKNFTQFFYGANKSYSQTNECDSGELAPTLVFDAIITSDIQTLSHLPANIQRL